MVFAIVTPSSAATVWDLNTDLAAVPGWPGDSPATGNWSMGWTKSLDQINLFETWLDGGAYVWHTDLTAAGEPFNPGGGGAPDGSTTPHGGFTAGKCFLAPSNYIVDPNTDPNYSVYTLVRWESPADAPQATIYGAFNQPAGGGKVDAWVVKIDNTQNLTTLYSYIDNNGPSRKAFHINTSFQTNDIIVFAIKRNNTEGGDNNGLSLIDVTITDEYIINPTPADPNTGPWVLNIDTDATEVDNGIWSYGWSDEHLANFTLMNTFLITAEGNNLWHSLAAGGTITPHVWFNSTTDGQYGVPLSWHGAHPPADDSAADWTRIRWKAPDTMIGKTLTMQGSFVGIGIDGKVDVKIVQVPGTPADPNDAEILFEVNDAATDQIFFVYPTISEGDSIDAIIGQGSDGTGNDWTGLDITITDALLYPTCQQQGIYMDIDLNQDCYVNLADFAIIAGKWLYCNDPQNPSCQ
jgi:hypothetical protein